MSSTSSSSSTSSMSAPAAVSALGPASIEVTSDRPLEEPHSSSPPQSLGPTIIKLQASPMPSPGQSRSSVNIRITSEIVGNGTLDTLRKPQKTRSVPLLRDDDTSAKGPMMTTKYVMTTTAAKHDTRNGTPVVKDKLVQSSSLRDEEVLRQPQSVDKSTETVWSDHSPRGSSSPPSSSSNHIYQKAKAVRDRQQLASSRSKRQQADLVLSGSSGRLSASSPASSNGSCHCQLSRQEQAKVGITASGVQGATADGSSNSGRSSVSSLASSGSTCSHHRLAASASQCSGGGAGRSAASTSQLNQALAIVANKWDREQRRQDQESIRRLTVLKQRKMSAMLKVDNLQKSLKEIPSGSDTPVIQAKLVQVKELEEEVASVDRELDNLAKEKEENTRRLNMKRDHHMATLQRLGLLDSVESPDSDGHYSSLRWNSEAELTSNLHGPATEEIFPPYQPKKATRKLSPPLAMAARLLSESRMRSGSDPALIKKAADENSRKPFMATLKSGMRSKSGNPGGSAQDVGRSSPSSSPKIGRRNPLRMLSNAIDFRGRRRNLSGRVKSTEGSSDVNEDPSGCSDKVGTNNNSLVFPESSVDPVDSYYTVAPPATPPILETCSPLQRRLREKTQFLSLSMSRHSLPTLNPEDMEHAVKHSTPEQPRRQAHSHLHREGLEQRSNSLLFFSGYATNPRPGKKNKSSAKTSNKAIDALVAPLENRNSAPEIVVRPPPQKAAQRAKGLLSSASSTAKLKLNSKLLLSNLAGVKRSRTFNISDVQEELAAIGAKGVVTSSRTLPSKNKKKNNGKLRNNYNSSISYSLESAGSSEHSCGGIAGSYGSSFDDSGSTGGSSRKSSNSSNHDSCGHPEKAAVSCHECAVCSSCSSSSAASDSCCDKCNNVSGSANASISQESLREIAAWEEFARGILERKRKEQEDEKSKRNDRTRKLSPVEMGDLVI